ncbi:MAG: TonB-dependent receptor plug domain-containing protein, partial [Opitutaceae bacterium]
GEMTARAALDAMLLGTGLTVVSEKNGAFSVRKETPGPNAPRAAQTRSDRPLANPPVEPVSASASKTRPPGEKDVIELSPFEVRTDQDRGFAATSSLAGGRLATDLRDTPAPYSIMTREFIDALNITDLAEAQGWMVSNTEVPGGTGGGRVDFVGDPDRYQTRGFTALQNPGGAKPLRNFFTSFVFPDSYASERFEFGRGPNAVLFGNGTLGGIPNTTTKRARTDRAFQTVKTNVVSEGGLRAELDINRPLSTDKAAVRAALLWQDQDGWRDRDFDKRKGAFVSATMKPFRNTEIRVDGEYYLISRQRGFTNIRDFFSGWDGATTYNSAVPLTTLPTDAASRGVGRYGANVYVYDPFGPANAVMSYQNQPRTLSGGSTATTPIAGFVQGNHPAFGVADTQLLHQNNLPAGRFNNAIANSLFRPITEEFTTSVDAPSTTQRFRDIQITLSHRIQSARFGEVFFEFAGDANRNIMLGNGIGDRGLQNVLIDINQQLPNGTPNPNFRKTYVEAHEIHNDFIHTYQAVRGGAAWVLNPNRFGKFTFSALGGISRGQWDRDWSRLTLADGVTQRNV